MEHICTYVFSYIFECRYGDGLLARPSYRLEPQVFLCSSWAPSPKGATSSTTWGGDLYTPRLGWQVCNEILLFITYVFVGIPLFRQFCLLQVTWVRSTDSRPSCRGWAYSARPIPPLSVETINLNCLCSLPCWLRMPTSTVWPGVVRYIWCLYLWCLFVMI